LLLLHPAPRNSEQFLWQFSIEILLKQGIRIGGVAIHGFQNETMNFSEGIRESGALFIETFVAHRHSEVTIGQKQTPPT